MKAPRVQIAADREKLIVVGESEDDASPQLSMPTQRSRLWLFHFSLKLLRNRFPEFEWISFEKSEQGVNLVTEDAATYLEMESLWQKELKSRFTSVQHRVMEESDCVVVSRDRETGAIVAFGTSRISQIGTIEGVRCRVTHGGLFVVDSQFQRKGITPFVASVATLYLHTLRTIFQNEIVVVRSNNRFVERILRRAEPVYRSDMLPSMTSDVERQIVEAIKWTHERVFHQSGGVIRYVDKQHISHKVAAEARTFGLEQDEAVYFSRASSLASFLYRVFFGKK